MAFQRSRKKPFIISQQKPKIEKLPKIRKRSSKSTEFVDLLKEIGSFEMENGVLPHRLKYNVFLSFRGFDTREIFCELLYVALNAKQKLRVFRDNEGMQRGDEIGPSLDLAMDDSAASVIILSTNYANSSS